MVGAVVRGMRVRQWVKNLLVVAAPVAAGQLLEPDVLVPTLLAFAGFCLLSSSVYLVNDVADVEADRLHPVKRGRPVAAGELTPSVALAVAAALAVVAFGLGALASLELVLVMAGYLVLQVLYAVWLKHEPVLDLAVVTLGFLLRTVAGGLAAEIPISQWFLLVAGFGSLFVVAGKRYSELHTLGSEAGTRRSLIRYTDTYLRFVWSIAAGATVMSYSLWAFENGAGAAIPWHMISIAPFVVAMLRYAVDIDAGTAAEPEEIVWRDRLLQGIGVLWLVVFLLGVAGVGG